MNATATKPTPKLPQVKVSVQAMRLIETQAKALARRKTSDAIDTLSKKLRSDVDIMQEQLNKLRTPYYKNDEALAEKYRALNVVKDYLLRENVRAFGDPYFDKLLDSVKNRSEMIQNERRKLKEPIKDQEDQLVKQINTTRDLLQTLPFKLERKMSEIVMQFLLTMYVGGSVDAIMNGLGSLEKALDGVSEKDL